MVLQAYIDESGSENTHNALILGGYIATAEKWTAFSDEWGAALRVQPALAAFKMNDAVRLKGEFRFWTEASRDERLRHLRRIIDKHALYYISCVVPFGDFHKAIKVLSYKIKMTPYGAALLLLMGGARRYREMLEINERIDFIFDDQVMEKTRLLENWDEIANEIKGSERDFVSNTPIFRDDEDAMPLQAADMLAWLDRNRWEHRVGTTPLYQPPWGADEDATNGLTFVYDEASLRLTFQRAHEHAIAEIKELGSE